MPMIKKCKNCGTEFKCRRDTALFCTDCKIKKYKAYQKEYYIKNKDKLMAKKKAKRPEKKHENICVDCGRAFETKQGVAKFCLQCLKQRAITSSEHRKMLERRAGYEGQYLCN